MPSDNILLIAATGKVGRRVAKQLGGEDVSVRRAARKGADVEFDWDRPETFAPALAGIGRVSLALPSNSLVVDPEQIGRFLDAAIEAGVEHVTYLTARGAEQAPPQVPLRAAEIAIEERDAFTHTILRAAWFMQNFSEAFFLEPIREAQVIPIPAGDGAETFVDAEDLAAATAATLLDPGAHAGRDYTLTGPEALTMAEAAERISAATGLQVHYVDVDRGEWVDKAVAEGVPADYAEVLAGLTDAIKAGADAEVTDDVRLVTGREPRSFATFAADARQVWLDGSPA